MSRQYFSLCVMSFVILSAFNVYAGVEKCPKVVGISNNGEWCDAYYMESEKKNSDKKLNTVYAKFLKGMPLQHKKKWIVAERAWINYKDAYCYAVSTNMPQASSTQNFVLNSCLKDEIEKHTAQLIENCEICNDK